MRAIDQVSDRLAAWLLPEEARLLLTRKVGTELSFLDRMTGKNKLSHSLTCKALAASYGFDVLFDPEVRKALFTRLSAPIIDIIWGALHMDSGGIALDTEKRSARLQRLKLTPGKYRARRLCEALELPYECAGDATSGRSPEMELFPPQINLPPLHDFQLELASRIRSELLESKGDRRAMLTLPTGGGKTRVVLETLLDWSPIEGASGTLLWVAQHEELCEQAIECVAQIWASRKRPDNRSIKIQRVWGGKASEIDWSADVIVGIPESLSSRVLLDRAGIKRRLKVVVIDEAHQAVSDVYDPVFEAAGVAKVPVLGVSATPANPQSPSGVLQQCFENRLLRAPCLGSQPYLALCERGVLSQITFEAIDSGAKIDMSDDEGGDLRDSGGDYGKAILGRLGRDSRRNRTIIERLARLPRNVQTLGFASSVESAHALAAAMTIFGREAAAVDATTSATVRRRTLSSFKSGETQFLFNFGVLATGFDAPSVGCLLMARPTRSLVLLEQMLGRGLRGPKNQGTETCRLLWIEDDFVNAGELQPQSYQRFAKLWSVNDG